MPTAKELGERSGVYRLGGDILLDGRVSWAPPDVERTQPVNNYLIVGDRGALLVDTGLRLHEQEVLEQLAERLPRDVPLAVLLTRTEMECCLNLPAIENRFAVESVWYTGGITVPRSRAEARRVALEPGTSMQLEPVAGIMIELISPLFRLLPTLWVFHRPSGVLLSSDGFTHRSSQSSRPEDGLVKFRWFADADTRPIARDVRNTVAERPVQIIAPGYGISIEGRGACVLEAERLATAIEGMGRDGRSM